jgi:hypothetical protein
MSPAGVPNCGAHGVPKEKELSHETAGVLWLLCVLVALRNGVTTGVATILGRSLKRAITGSSLKRAVTGSRANGEKVFFALSEDAATLQLSCPGGRKVFFALSEDASCHASSSKMCSFWFLLSLSN